MRKQPEVEAHIKSIIKDELALRPLASVQKVRNALCVAGYTTANGLTLDWHYVAKLMRKVRIENLVALSRENRMIRLAAIKERHRVFTENLTPIAEGRILLGMTGTVITPTPRDMIAAANMIMRWDICLLFAEEQINLLNKQDMIRQKRIKTKTLILTDSVEASSFSKQNNLINQVFKLRKQSQKTIRLSN